MLGLGRAAPEVRAALVDLSHAGLVALPLSFLVLRPFVLEAFSIVSSSMEPTLYGCCDRILVHKFIYWLRPPRRQEIVVFTSPESPADRPVAVVKRLIGLPGETVRIRRGRVMIQRAGERPKRLVEPYLPEPPHYQGVYEVPEDTYFVLGDNRNRSYDSHVWGALPRSYLRGKALLIFWPPQRIRWLRGGEG